MHPDAEIGPPSTRDPGSPLDTPDYPGWMGVLRRIRGVLFGMASGAALFGTATGACSGGDTKIPPPEPGSSSKGPEPAVVAIRPKAGAGSVEPVDCAGAYPLP